MKQIIIFGLLFKSCKLLDSDRMKDDNVLVLL